MALTPGIRKKDVKPLSHGRTAMLGVLANLATASLSGLRTDAMLCPLLPGVADSPEHIDQIRADDAGVIWLGNEPTGESTQLGPRQQ